MYEQRPPQRSERLLRTVAGPLATARVRGPVLPHEHLALDLSHGGDAEAVLDGRHMAPVGAELGALREEFGLSLVVELTCRGMGRDVRALARLSRESGVAVVAGTGWYYERFHPEEAATADAGELAELLIHEIEDGIGPESGAGGGTSARDHSRDAGRDLGLGSDSGSGSGSGGTPVRPGVIGEAGSHGDVPSAQEVRTLTAAALAARATGLSVATHAQLGRGGLAQIEVLTGAGLAPHRVCVGHQDLLDDPGVHRELAAAGAYIAFDTVGKENYRSDGSRLRLLLALLEAGHAERALLSCDISRHGYLRSEGGRGYGHLFRSFLPRLRAAGADDDLIDLLTRRNPLRFLTGDDGDIEGKGDVEGDGDGDRLAHGRAHDDARGRAHGEKQCEEEGGAVR
ncbi:phosphotriesterase family protein [Streptomyces marispadix]|uniref:Phosphotriesterase n=1 Tax=Streptomyces marispadix TaxID=2922868 RepID=A0ABS9T2V6_9ACTN|nr:phosphotriesterase [Streptomyces marispadix]MCH6162856.1 phosphotriesterase [Streptomyces marispadix]